MFKAGDKVHVEGYEGVFTVKGMFGNKAVAIFIDNGHAVRPIHKVSLARETKIKEI